MNIKPGVFITGTDTHVGKTVVAAGLALTLRSRGLCVGVMKPVATGCEGFADRLISHDAVYLWEAAENEYPPLTNPSRFRHPLAPHVAAALESSQVDIKGIHQAFHELQKHYDYVIVEGIGGIFVPLTKDYYVANLIRDFQLPIIIVANTGLGAINHTLLTIDAALVRGFDIKGVIFNRLHTTNVSLAEMTNPKTIHELTGIPVLGSLPEIPEINVEQCRYGPLQAIFEERIRVDKIVANPTLTPSH